ncbi:MAG: ATP-binding cassette domain-containing protein [Clostridium fessum]
MAKNILEIKNLTFSFHTYGGVVKSVRDVSFNVREGEILGIVGESGCGKSVTSQCILKLNPEPPGFFEGGRSSIKARRSSPRQTARCGKSAVWRLDLSFRIR